MTVVVYHYLLAYGPFTWSGFTPGRLTVLGDLPVCVFFVLSGFVLAESASRSRAGLPTTILARYLRLTIPMTASLVLACLWLRAFPHSREAIQANEINPWLSTAFITHQTANLLPALRDGIAGVYLTGTSFFNSVVWTMKIEFFGSVLIYLLYRFIPPCLRWLGLAGLGAIALHNLFYLGFAFGGALRECRTPSRTPKSPWGWAALIASFTLVIIAEGRTPATFALLSLAAALIVIAILTIESLQRALDSTPAQFFGRISFSLYLVHAPLLVTVMAWYQLHADDIPHARFAIGLAAFSTLSLALAWLMTRLIDEPLLAALRRWKMRKAP